MLSVLWKHEAYIGQAAWSESGSIPWLSQRHRVVQLSIRMFRCLTEIVFFAETVGYVPDGMSPEQYRKLKKKEQEEQKAKKFGAFGPQSFKSRSLQAFQKDLEAGKANHLMPVMNAKERLKKKELKQEDIPYMQRLGSWDDSDLGKKRKWRKEDEKYNANASPAKFDWMGNAQKTGPKQGKQTGPSKPETKKLFGLF